MIGQLDSCPCQDVLPVSLQWPSYKGAVLAVFCTLVIPGSDPFLHIPQLRYYYNCILILTTFPEASFRAHGSSFITGWEDSESSLDESKWRELVKRELSLPKRLAKAKNGLGNSKRRAR